MNFLVTAELCFQELKFKNDILEQFDKIKEALGYIKVCNSKMHLTIREPTPSPRVLIKDESEQLQNRNWNETRSVHSDT